MRNLKLATRDGCPMSDPRGDLSDYPEQLLIACTASKHSPISLAIAAQFGDPLLHPPQTRPYWKDWGDACPSFFLTPDSLHQWHKFYFDHPVNWSINIMGGAELNHRLSALQPRVGVRHWANGISMLKQLTGCEHQDLEKLLPGMIVGAVSDEVASQNLFLYDKTLHSLSEALHEFHYYKDFILTAGGRRGKNGPLNHFQIPKLELMQHVVRSTRAMGAPYQWSSNITEHCHITHVKQPYCLSNHKDFHGQCCHFLNWQEKLHFFQLYMVLKSRQGSKHDGASLS
ncbi:uncharacterized protein HD556DRAFT_1429421 [Suillus plorans]|uniref:Uncharacterized protein n=1 Tax=Suillus plorans TaxID=116603 RepID=A0A9P7DUY6_9AGAM|nr:uncharacterized protein HD556DRAFT_1429421 [Suillus plorans]KAG1803838.1 hypothetical protein HD556DRAFT_1429421 [Suillus plorans]